ncbi:hypothetical protein [Lentilitoribacter sp. Alg239-R112]|uniref:hypothetical protein n=1 Tax=Lentilitoribacter sp. Alg239-R112 TaxID=2305987 RepID=UPI0018D927F2|nr:hypothetical protein [Lentilitoribacter sp. Alg239-R112]
MQKRIRTYLNRIKHAAAATAKIPNHLSSQKILLEKQLLLSGRQASVQIRQQSYLSHLSDAEFSVYSQWGEDGIIDWLIQNLPIENTSFVEFGVENFSEANCRFLLENRNWRGMVMDGNQSHIDFVRAQTYYWKYDLNAHCAFITAENINDLLAVQGFGGEIGLLSIDIDGNDYWVLNAIDCCKPAILVLEYNSILGDLYELSVPYSSDFYRFDAHYSGLYFGASLPAMNSLARNRGYTFVGTNSNGVNAFYVRDDLAQSITDSLGSVVGFPSRHRDSRDKKGQLNYMAGLARSVVIEDLPIVNVDSGKTLLIKELGSLYSREWLSGM